MTGWLAIIVALSHLGLMVWAPVSAGAPLPILGTTVGLLPTAVVVAAGVVLLRDVHAWVDAAATYLAVLGAMSAATLPAQVRWVVTPGTSGVEYWSAVDAVAGLALAVLAVLVVLGGQDEPAPAAPTGWVRGVGVACAVALALSAALPWWSVPGFGGIELIRGMLRWPLAFQLSSILGVLVTLGVAGLVGSARRRGVWLGAVAGLLGSRPIVLGSLVSSEGAEVGPEPALWVALAAQVGLAVVLVLALARPARDRDHGREPASAP